MNFSLNMDISELKNISFKSNKPEKIKYPTKRTINLAMKEDDGKSKGLMIGGIVLGVLVLAVGVKFGIIDQYAKLRAVQQEYDAVYAQRVALEEKIADYDEVEQEYRSYSRDWMTEDTTGKYVSVDRLDILDMLERVVFYKGTVENLTIDGSKLMISMSDMDLQEISEMFIVLQEEELVESATLNMAETEEDHSQSGLSFTLTIVLIDNNTEVTK